MAAHLLPLTVAVLVAAAAVLPLALGAPMASCDDYDYASDDEDCTIFYQCVHGNHVKMDCPADTHWSGYSKACVNKRSAEDVCTLQFLERECAAEPNGFRLPFIFGCSIYLTCEHDAAGTPQTNFLSCPPGENFDETSRACQNAQWTHCGVRPMPTRK